MGPDTTLVRRALAATVAIAVTLIITYVLVIGFRPLPALEFTPAPGITQAPAVDSSAIDVALESIEGAEGIRVVAAAPEDGPEASSPSSYEAVSSDEQYSLASITKLISVLTALEQKPLAPGEAGDLFTISARDRQITQSVLARNGVAANAPIGQTFTEQELLQIILLESANDLAISYVTWVFGSEAEFLNAAREYLAAHGFEHTEIVEPTGLDAGNVSTPHEVLQLGQLALENPTIAAITRMSSVQIPGWGEVKSTNWFVQNEGALGLKTGTLLTDYFNILVAEDDSRAGRTFTTFVVTLDKPSQEARISETAEIFDAVDKTLVEQTVLGARALAGMLTTWQGDSIDLVSANAEALTTVLLPGEEPQISVEVPAVRSGSAGDQVGTITVTDPTGPREVAVELASAVEIPSFWWRLTHPREVLGL